MRTLLLLVTLLLFKPTLLALEFKLIRSIPIPTNLRVVTNWTVQSGAMNPQNTVNGAFLISLVPNGDTLSPIKMIVDRNGFYTFLKISDQYSSSASTNIESSFIEDGELKLIERITTTSFNRRYNFGIALKTFRKGVCVVSRDERKSTMVRRVKKTASAATEIDVTYISDPVVVTLEKINSDGEVVDSTRVDGTLLNDPRQVSTEDAPSANSIISFKAELDSWNFYLLEDEDLYPQSHLRQPTIGSDGSLSVTVETSALGLIKLENSPDLVRWKVVSELMAADGAKVPLPKIERQSFMRLTE